MMADREQHEILIVKRRGASESEHHGGAWKIAFADFMTAMMALFLVLWLISSTSDKTKHAVAQYFNPVKLVDVTTMKKGFRNPKKTEMAAGPQTSEASEESDSKKIVAETREVVQEPGAKRPTHSEAALFRDPYAVLSDIAGDRPEDARSVPPSGPEEAAGDAAPDAVETFRDPFATNPEIAEPPARSVPRVSGSTSAESDAVRQASAPVIPAASARPETHAVRQASSPIVSEEPPPARPLASVAASAAAGPEAERAAEATRLRAEITASSRAAASASGPTLEVRPTADGILISLTDDRNFSMFAIGSAEPRKETVLMMDKVASALKSRAGQITIRGYTDGRPFRSANYDNWRLSSSRAHMAQYMLTRGGVDEKRIERIEGYADRRPKTPADPLAPANRRVEILLREAHP